ncbi:MAG: hypothetical protein CM15mP84_11210 [Cellvibrionales bacterium]|nr:MAG: hypothetical protein CM15mP84_11210 [Cellvibrionales bacterium]
MGPQGQHVLAANVMYVPHDLKSGWTPERRAELLNTVLSELTRYAPGIQDLVLGSELLTPQDLQPSTARPTALASLRTGYRSVADDAAYL